MNSDVRSVPNPTPNPNPDARSYEINGEIITIVPTKDRVTYVSTEGWVTIIHNDGSHLVSDGDNIWQYDRGSNTLTVSEGGGPARQWEFSSYSPSANDVGSDDSVPYITSTGTHPWASEYYRQKGEAVGNIINWLDGTTRIKGSVSVDAKYVETKFTARLDGKKDLSFTAKKPSEKSNAKALLVFRFIGTGNSDYARDLDFGGSYLHGALNAKIGLSPSGKLLLDIGVGITTERFGFGVPVISEGPVGSNGSYTFDVSISESSIPEEFWDTGFWWNQVP